MLHISKYSYVTQIDQYIYSQYFENITGQVVMPAFLKRRFRIFTDIN